MTAEDFPFQHPSNNDIIQPGDFVTMLLIALAIFIFIQIMNGIMNIITARRIRKNIEVQAKVREDENRLLADQWENVLIKFEEILERTSDIEEKVEYLMDKVDDIPQPTIIRKRGKYKPRKPKELEHKKTPSEN